MIKDVRRKCTFDATDEEGNTHHIAVFVDILDVATFEDPDGEIEGMEQLLTMSGQHVNCLAKGKYQIVESGRVLRSADPTAP
jgi:hypothetical protein